MSSSPCFVGSTEQYDPPGGDKVTAAGVVVV